MDIDFKKVSDFNRGIIYELLTDAYSFDDRCVKCWSSDWKEFDNFFFDNLQSIISKYKGKGYGKMQLQEAVNRISKNDVKK